jgi:hypothetical protein
MNGIEQQAMPIQTRSIFSFVFMHITPASSLYHVAQKPIHYQGGRFSPVFSTNKADCHDITEILLKVALNTIKLLTKIRLLVFIIIFSNFYSYISYQ